MATTHDRENLQRAARLALTRRRVLGGAGTAAALVAAGLTGLRTSRSGATAAQDVDSLTFWVISPFTDNEDAPIYEALGRYEAETGVAITLESFPPASFRERLTTTVLGGGGPDIASVDSAWVSGLAASEILTPIDEEFGLIADQFFEGPVDTGAYLGVQYAVPWYTNNVALYWNKTMFQEAGLDGPPETWDQLVEYGKQLTTDDQYGLMLGTAGFGPFLWFPFAWQNGAELISEDGTEALFASPEGIEAWEFLAGLYLDEGIVPEDIKSATESWDQYFAPFIQERVAMMMTGDWGIRPIREGAPDLDFGVAPLPVGKEAATVIGGYDLAIPVSSEKQAAAWDFLEWFTAQEQEPILQAYNRIPARKSILDSEYATEDPFTQVFIEQAAVGRARATVPEWSSIEDQILADAWTAVILGQAEPAEALTTAAEETNALLAE